jgi:hypothetical protein
LYVREEVVLANEVKHIWAAESEEEREGFAWLTVGYVSIFKKHELHSQVGKKKECRGLTALLNTP